MIRILSTKKLQPNQRQFLLNAGFAVTEADFIATRPIDFKLNGICDNLIFTSGNAVKAVSAHNDVQQIRRKPVFCVGDHTADLLDANGFTVQETGINAATLAQVVVNEYRAESFTFFSGNQRLDALPNRLDDAQLIWNEIVVYETSATPRAVGGNFDALLFFSPSAAYSFLSANQITNETCFCIGNTTAKALEGITQNTIVANQPSVENTIIQAINTFGRNSKV